MRSGSALSTAIAFIVGAPATVPLSVQVILKFVDWYTRPFAVPIYVVATSILAIEAVVIFTESAARPSFLLAQLVPKFKLR